MTTIEDEEELERELRQLLTPVELVCEADIPQYLVDAAEAAALPMIKAEQYRRLAHRFPAITATYLVCCGSERYARNTFWPQLGVLGNSSDVGRSFLEALDELALPNFEALVEQAGARRYVAPILIHGALPSNVASRLVERVEQELRRGLVDGAEARRRMLQDRDIEQVLRRPATRLLQWCPAYADRLLDAVIDHIENPGGAGLTRLPIHLQQALLSNANRRQDLRRLAVPAVEFQLWSGFGPEAVGVPALRWSIEFGDRIVQLAQDERVEVPPATDVVATIAGRRLPLFTAQDVLFFDHSGRPVPADAKVPSSVVVILPRDWSLRTVDGDRLPEDEEGVALSGTWSRHRSCGITVANISTIYAGPTNEPEQHVVRRSVADDTEARLVGAVIAAAAAAHGGTVFSTLPSIEVPGATAPSIGAWFVATDNTSRYISLERSGGLYQLGDLPPSGAIAGTLQLRTVGPARGSAIPFTVVPGLDVIVPTTPLGPADSAVITVIADDGVLAVEGELVTGAQESQTYLDIVGLPPQSVSVPLPRVQWSLRSERLARLDLASGVINIDHASLVKEPLWLNVRCGQASHVGLQLKVSGQTVQRVQTRPTRSTGPAEHHRSIALDELRDTIRAHPDEAVEVLVVVDGSSFVALACGGTVKAPSTRSWAGQLARPEADETFKNVEWLQSEPLRKQSASALELRLRQLRGDDAVVLFLQTVGHHQTSWRLTEFPSGRSGQEWVELMAVANALWRIDGVRLRDFTGNLDENLRRWARTRREETRRADDQRRQDIETWLLGRVPDVSLLSEWQHWSWLEATLPPKSSVSCQWFPATVLYHCVALLAGQNDSGPVVASAIDLAPALVLEVVAFLMQAFRNGQRISPPEFAVDVDDDVAEDSSPEIDDAEVTLPALVLAECAIEATGPTITVTAPRPSVIPMFRLSESGRPLALLTPGGDDRRITLQRPLDIDGIVQISTVDSEMLGVSVSGNAVVTLSKLDAPPPAKSTRVSDPANLREAQLNALVDRISEIVQRGGTAKALVQELFSDERDGALALSRLPHRWGSSVLIDRVAIAALPAAMLFNDLGLAPAQVGAQRDRVLFAAIAPRRPATWTRVGWPNSSHFDSGSRPLDDLVGFALKLARRHSDFDLRTMRYEPTSHYPNSQSVDGWVHQMNGSFAQPAFLDLIVTTHRMLTVEALIGEATRTLLEAHRQEPAAVSDAVLAGVALYIATRPNTRSRTNG